MKTLVNSVTSNGAIKFNNPEDMYNFYYPKFEGMMVNLSNSYSKNSSINEFEDCMQGARLELFEVCTKKYNEEKFVGQIKNYAEIAITGALIDMNELKDSDREKVGKVSKVLKDNESDNLTASELVIKTGMSLKAVEHALRLKQTHLSFEYDIKNEDGDNFTLYNVVGYIDKGYRNPHNQELLEMFENLLTMLRDDYINNPKRNNKFDKVDYAILEQEINEVKYEIGYDFPEEVAKEIVESYDKRNEVIIDKFKNSKEFPNLVSRNISDRRIAIRDRIKKYVEYVNGEFRMKNNFKR